MGRDRRKPVQTDYGTIFYIHTAKTFEARNRKAKHINPHVKKDILKEVKYKNRRK